MRDKDGRGAESGGEWRSLYALASVLSQLLGYVGRGRYRFAARRPPRSALVSKFPPVYDR